MLFSATAMWRMLTVARKAPCQDKLGVRNVSDLPIDACRGAVGGGGGPDQRSGRPGLRAAQAMGRSGAVPDAGGSALGWGRRLADAQLGGQHHQLLRRRIVARPLRPIDPGGHQVDGGLCQPPGVLHDRGGQVDGSAAISVSSKPTTEMSAGTRTPWRLSSRTSAAADASLNQITAVGNGLQSSTRPAARTPSAAMFPPSITRALSPSPQASMADR